jgi:quercetin dioxygenase-like cupin family protein
MHPGTLLFLVFLSLFFGGQDAVRVNPKIVSVEYENESIRVLRVKFAAHDRLEMHSHPSLVVVALTPNSRRIFQPDGTKKDAQASAGDVTWREPGIHAVENLGDAFENIEIEFKRISAPAVPVASSGVDANKPVAGETIPVEQEPHHHVLFRNQYVCVLDVQIPPGESLLFHKHSYDNLSIRVSGGLIQNQMEGSDWPAPSEVTPGAVVFAEASKKPYTHRVKNVGNSVYHVVDVELLQ